MNPSRVSVYRAGALSAYAGLRPAQTRGWLR